MSTSIPRWVAVDDADPSINYAVGPWFQDNSGSQDNAGNFGPPYKGTLHGTKQDASLSFAFNGTRVRVWGSNNLRNDSGVLDPTWECFVDKISIGKTSPFQFAENNWLFCEQDQLVDGPHVLTVNATVAKQQTFWLDQIQYVPSANVPLDGKAVLVDNLDPALQFGNGWGSLGGSANRTTQTNSLFKYDFVGVSLAWYGFIPTEYPHTSSTGSYTVDGSDPVTFLLKGLGSASSTTIYNQKFFETQQFPAGQHSITVTYQGSGTTTPLTLDYLVVQNGTFPQSSNTNNNTNSGSGNNTNSGSGNNSNPAQDSTASTNSKHSNIGAIAGGVIGGVVLVLLAILAFLYLRRREKKLKLKKMSDEGSVYASGGRVEPFGYTAVPVVGHTDTAKGHQPSVSGITPFMLPPRQTGSSTNVNRPTHAQMPSASTTELHSAVTQPSSWSGMYTSSSSGHGRPVPGAGPIPGGNVNEMGQNSVASQRPESPLSEKARREAAATASILRPQQRGLESLSNDNSSSRVVVHADSGVRMRPTTSDTIDVPPNYTPD